MKEKLMLDLKESMKSRDTLRKSVVTMLRAAVKQVEVDNRTELSDDEIIAIVHKQIKQKKAALPDFEKAEREDLVKETLDEIEVLSAYLPKQLTDEELAVIIDEEIVALAATNMKDMGKVMSAVRNRVKSSADGSAISRIVKERLSK